MNHFRKFADILIDIVVFILALALAALIVLAFAQAVIDVSPNALPCEELILLELPQPVWCDAHPFEQGYPPPGLSHPSRAVDPGQSVLPAPDHPLRISGRAKQSIPAQ